ncbi:MAG: transketolase [Candidatus Gastranaerophilaceae bacterium]|jgi:transketolase
MTQIAELNEKEIAELKELSTKVRCHIVKMISNAKSGHPGGSLSMTDILVTLYSKCMKHYPQWDKHPDWKTRDRFILSKGHASSALYAVLAEHGYFDTEELLTFRKLHSRLQGHPSYGYLPGIEVSTGSLGQGLSIACGMALGLRLDKINSKVFVYLGDGELQEGQVWEGAMNASHQKLGNVIAFVDRNKLQIDGCTENIKAVHPVGQKFEAFGWQVLEIDGHNHQEIFKAINRAKLLGEEASKPVVIIANTVKGKGVAFMENNAGWHGKAPTNDECTLALELLSSS